MIKKQLSVYGILKYFGLVSVVSLWHVVESQTGLTDI